MKPIPLPQVRLTRPNGRPSASTSPCKARNRHARGFCGLVNTHLAANTEHLGVQVGEESEAVQAVNTLTVDSDGWAKLAGYGDFPNPGVKGGVRHIQRIDRQSADRLAANFRPLLKRLLRVQTGLPMFKGHPDAPGMETRFPDKTPYGTIADVQARDDGVYVRPVITQDGVGLVEQGWKFLSSFWNQEQIGQTADGTPIASPFELLSVGLVKTPNIPGPAINSLPDNKTNPPMNKLLLQFLALLGKPLAANAAEADVIAAGNEVVASLPAVLAATSTLKTEHAALTTKVTDLTAANTQLTTEKGTLAANVTTLTEEKRVLAAEKLAAANAQTEADTKVTAAANAAKEDRRVAAESVIGAAVLTGRIPAAEKASKVTALIGAANFADEVAKIEVLSPRLKTLPTFSTKLDNNAVLDAASRREQLHAAVNARMNEQHEDYTTAYQAVKADKKFAALFGAMKQPEKA